MLAVPVMLASLPGAAHAQGPAPSPVISISDTSVSEAAGNAVFTVSLDRPSNAPVRVTYRTGADPAGTSDATGGTSCTRDGVDYVSQSSSVLIPANANLPPSRTISVPICNDTRDEEAESFVVTLTGADRFSIDPSQNQGRAIINDNDGAPSLVISNRSVSEGDGDGGTQRRALFDVRLSQASGKTVTVNYSTREIPGGADGGSTCAGPVDFLAVSNAPLSFAPGETLQRAEVLICGDEAQGSNEQFEVRLSNPSNATIADGTAVGTIRNDDTPRLRIDDVAVAEPALGESLIARFTVSLGAILEQDVTVHYATRNGSASGGGSCEAESGPDYVSESGTARINAGNLSTQVTIRVCGNGSQLGNRTFNVDLSNASGNVPIADAHGLGNIQGLTLVPNPNLPNPNLQIRLNP
jgi:chitinase